MPCSYVGAPLPSSSGPLGGTQMPWSTVGFGEGECLHASVHVSYKFYGVTFHQESFKEGVSCGLLVLHFLGAFNSSEEILANILQSLHPGASTPAGDAGEWNVSPFFIFHR